MMWFILMMAYAQDAEPEESPNPVSEVSEVMDGLEDELAKRAALTEEFRRLAERARSEEPTDTGAPESEPEPEPEEEEEPEESEP